MPFDNGLCPSKLIYCCILSAFLKGKSDFLPELSNLHTL